MHVNNLGDFYTTGKEDVWQMVSFCSFPTTTLRNLKTGEEIDGAVGSPDLKPFVRLVLEKQIKEVIE